MEAYDHPVVEGSRTKSAVFMPIAVGNEVIGVISLQNNDQENAFRDSDLQLLEALFIDIPSRYMVVSF